MSSFRSKILRPVGLAAALTLLLAAAPAVGANLTWNTFQGGQAIDQTNDVYVNELTGEIYVCGLTDLYSWGSPVRPFSGGGDAFVAKLDQNGTLVWLTFLGGTGQDNCAALAGNSSAIYVAGSSNASWGNPVVAHHGGLDQFVAALDPATGALQWNTFDGSDLADEAFDIDVHNGAIYTTGYSGDFAVFARFDGAGNRVWSRRVGGSRAPNQGRSIRVDSNGDLLVLGNSGAAWAITGLTPARPYAGGTDAFLLKVRISDQAPLWFTFLGGPDDDIPTGLTDQFDDIYVSGYSDSSWGSPVRPYAGLEDGWVAQLYAPNGTLVANTFLGSASGRDYAYDLHFKCELSALWQDIPHKHGGRQPPEDMDEKTLGRAHLAGDLDTGFLLNPIEDRLDGLAHPRDGAG